MTTGHVSKTRGGVDRVTDTLAHEFLAKGHNVYMVSLWNAIAGDPIEEYQYILPSQEIISADNCRWLSEFFKRKDVDIIVCQSDLSLMLDLLNKATHKIPIISAIHTDPAALIKGVTDTWDYWKVTKGNILFTLTRPYWWLRKSYQYYTRCKYARNKLRKWYDESDAVVLLSQRFIPIYTRIAQLEYNKKLYAISNPIKYTDSSNNFSKEKIILFVGRLDFQKRLDRLLKVWKGIKDHNGWRILILGEGNCRESYECLCRSMKLKDVSFEGRVNPTQYYEKAEIVCVTSSYEGFSMVILEGLSNEVIPIAFKSYESVSDLIKNEQNGYLVPAFFTTRYRECLQRLMQDDELRARIRQQIRQDNTENRTFESSVIADRWLQLFTKILKDETL